MWITVENQRIFGDISLGISQVLLRSSSLSKPFPQRSPQLFTAEKNHSLSAIRKVICNYKSVISFTHLSTAVITTNFKYKFLPHKVLFSPRSVFQGAAL
jgi:hypothetical protein